jgi:hypothetical protein
MNSLSFLKNNNDVTEEEKNYADSFFLPLLTSITALLGNSYKYEHREAFLTSMTTLLLQTDLKKKKNEGYKTDGIISYKNDDSSLLKVCGFFGNSMKSKIQYDRHKGLYGLLGMLKTIANKYNYSSLVTFEKLQIIFTHTKGSSVQTSPDYKYFN